MLKEKDLIARILELEKGEERLKSRIRQQSVYLNAWAERIAKEIERRNEVIISAIETRDKASQNLIEQLIKAVRWNKGNIISVQRAITPLLLEHKAREEELIYYMLKHAGHGQKYPF